MDNQTIGLVPGTGKQSQGIALRLGKAGFNLLIGSRSKEKAEQKAIELNEKLGREAYRGFQNSDVVKKASIVFFVVPPEHLESTLEKLVDHFTTDTIIVDVIVPLKFKDGLIHCDLELIDEDMHYLSVSEYIQASVPKGVSVVGGFKTISAAKLNNLTNPLAIDLFLTGDNKEAKAIMKNILEQIEGLRVLDAGTLKFSRTTEQMTALVVNLNKLNKLKHASFKVISTSKK